MLKNSPKSRKMHIFQKKSLKHLEESKIVLNFALAKATVLMPLR